MTVYKFGSRSLSRMEGVDPQLVMCTKMALAESRYDMTVAHLGGLRTVDVQYELYKDNYSKCDGTKKKSYHQSGLAIDVIPVGKMPYENKVAMNHFANKMLGTWQKLLAEGKVTGIMRWGGTFGDGWDAPHYEIRR